MSAPRISLFQSLIRGSRTALAVAAVSLGSVSCTSGPDSRGDMAPTPGRTDRATAPRVQPVAIRPERQMGRADAPTGRADSVLMVDARSGKVLASKNPDKRRQVASTQKLLTALLVAERGNLDQIVRIQPSDTWVEPSKLGFAAGDRYTRRQLLEASLVRSCNDAALALARDHSGSVKAFVANMNRRAREFGCYDSNFRNPHGLTEPGQYSTARDVSRIAWVAYRNQVIRSIIRRDKVLFRYTSGKTRTLENTNKLLGHMPGCNGMKTGYTRAAGRCLVSTASSGGREVIVVQLGSKTVWIFDDARTLLTYGLNTAGNRRFFTGR